MTKEVLEREQKTDVGRLQIKKIRKAKVASKIYGTLAIIQAIISASFGLTGIYSLVRGIKGEYYCDSPIMTYGAVVGSVILSMLAAIDYPELRRLRDEHKEEALFLEEEFYNPEEIEIRGNENGK